MFRQLKMQICKNMQNIQYTTFADIKFSDFSSVIFEVPVEKVVIDEEQLHGDRWHFKLRESTRTVFID